MKALINFIENTHRNVSNAAISNIPVSTDSKTVSVISDKDPVKRSVQQEIIR